MYKCKICKQLLKYMNNAHLKMHKISAKKYKKDFDKNVILSWNQGLTVKTDKRLKKIYRAIKEGYKSGRIKITEYRRKKISISKRGAKNPSKRQEVKDKISKALKGRKRPPFTLEHRKKIGEGNKGKIRTKSHKKQLSILYKGKTFEEIHGIVKAKIIKNKISKYSKGKTYVDLYGESRACKLIANKTGANSTFWKGGISYRPYSPEFNKIKKEQVRKRDNYMCQKCFIHESKLFTKNSKKSKLFIHHIDYNKSNNSLNNLISLCCSCHGKTSYDRVYWKKYYKERIKNAKSFTRKVKVR